MAHILLSQDALFLGADPASLLLWKQLGLRICQLTYNEQNLLGDGCLERHDGGLSQLGPGDGARDGALGRDHRPDPRRPAHLPGRLRRRRRGRSSRRIRIPGPVVDNPRNIDDEQMRAVAALGRRGLRHHLGAAHLARHARHAHPRRLAPLPRPRRAAGRHRPRRRLHRLDGDDGARIRRTRATPMPCPTARSPTRSTGWPSRPTTTTASRPISTASRTSRALVEALCAHGFGDDDIRKLLGGNLLRVFDATWKPGLAGMSSPAADAGSPA